MTGGGTARKSGPRERPELLTTKPELSLQCSFPETSALGEASVAASQGRGGGTAPGEKRGLFECHRPLRGVISRLAVVPVDSGSYVAIVMGPEVRLQWALVRLSLLKHHVHVPRAQLRGANLSSPG